MDNILYFYGKYDGYNHNVKEHLKNTINLELTKILGQKFTVFCIKSSRANLLTSGYL